jgi:predicted Zn finger-like uncharacterized protein
MLITACTDCGARFRVTPEQLNLHQGAVKCGSCGHVFNGFETLEQIPDEQFASFRDSVSEAGARSEAEDIAAPPERGAGRAELRAPEPEMPELESVDFAATPRPPAGRPAKETERLGAARPPRKAPERAATRAPALSGPPTRPHELPAPARRARPGPLWGAGAFLLFLGLVALVVFENRAPLATRYPDLRAPLQAACERLGCTVAWQNDEAAVKLEDSELLEVPGQPGQITLSTRIRNLSDHPQEYPQLQLTLTDIDGQASVRRVFSPADYLGRALKPGDAMPARADTLVSLRLEARRVKPTGYELLLFYP